MSKEVTYQLIKMVKNADYVLGDKTKPEYIQYGEAETKKAYFEEVIDATRTDLWPEKIDDTYKFENRCDPNSISPWESDQVFMLNSVVGADNADIPTISGFYDFINQPVPPQPDPPQPTPDPDDPDQPDVPGGGGGKPTQTGDMVDMGMIAGLSTLALLGFFVAMQRRRKSQNQA